MCTGKINNFGERKRDTMGLNVDTIARYVVQNHDVQFMQAQDYSTASQSEAVSIHNFLNNSSLRTARQEELTAYLLGLKDEQGNSCFTYDEAAKAAKYQLENEISQKKAKVTIQFIDKNEYDAAVAKAQKDGSDQFYNFKLITDKEVLAHINGDNLKTIEEKEANYKKFFKTDDKGNLVKDENGKYIFDSDKFKAEFGKDVGLDNKLQLAERECAAKRRGMSASSEKNAIKAAGLDYRRDNTGLYRTLAGTAALAALVFGGVTAEAWAGGAANSTVAAAHSVVHNRLASLLCAGGLAGAIPFIHDKDGKTNHRQDAAELFQQKPAPEPQKPQLAEVPPRISFVQEPKIEDFKLEKQAPCYNLEKGVTVDTIRYGGPWHYAQLYNNCDTGKPLTGKQLNELKNLLKPGHDGSSIQEGDSWKTKVLQNEITLSDGTKVCLADKEEIARRVARMTTQSGGKNLRYANQQIGVRTCDGTYIGSAKSVEDAHRKGIKYQQEHTTYTVSKK
jgi:hypothetical protein